MKTRIYAVPAVKGLRRVGHRTCPQLLHVNYPLPVRPHHLPQQVILTTSTQCDTLLYRAKGPTILNSQIP